MKKWNFWAIIIAALAIWSCSNTGWQEDEMNVEPQPQTTSTIEGVKVPNPYSVEAMKAACEVLYPTTRTGGSIADEIIVATHIYVRFLPANKEQMDALFDTQWELFNYPLDVEFDYDPSEYHDPSLPVDQITWQYAVIPIDSTLPTGITYEILEECYIPDDDETEVETTAGTIDIAAIEAVSVNFAETGVMNPTAVSLAKRTYSGRITVDGLPVKGIKVRIVGTLLSKSTTTRADGTYSVSGRLGESAKTEINFVNASNRIAFAYDFNLDMPSKVNIGTNRSVNLTYESYPKGWTLAHMNRATCMYYERCSELGIGLPPTQMRMWIIPMFRGASSPMFAHKTGYYINSLDKYMRSVIKDNTIAAITRTIFRGLLYQFGPDIILCNVADNTAYIYDYVFHELSHASHFNKLSISPNTNAAWWANVADYEIDCIINSNFSDSYGNANTPNNGHAGLAEMWAMAVGDIFYEELFLQEDIRSTEPSYPELNTYWFKPEIIWDLYLRGMPLSSMFNCLTSSVTSIQAFKNVLTTRNPNYTVLINDTFTSYGY